MAVKSIPGATCSVCRAQLIETTANCPSCGKLDLARLRQNLARAFAPIAVLGLLFFGGLAALTAFYNAESIKSGLISAIDDPFKPAVGKKK